MFITNGLISFPWLCCVTSSLSTQYQSRQEVCLSLFPGGSYHLFTVTDQVLYLLPCAHMYTGYTGPNARTHYAVVCYI